MTAIQLTGSVFDNIAKQYGLNPWQLRWVPRVGSPVRIVPNPIVRIQEVSPVDQVSVQGNATESLRPYEVMIPIDTFNLLLGANATQALKAFETWEISKDNGVTWVQYYNPEDDHVSDEVRYRFKLVSRGIRR